jgi:hypothetical protein
MSPAKAAYIAMVLTACALNIIAGIPASLTTAQNVALVAITICWACAGFAAAHAQWRS